jgi:hypothetical protein
MVAYAALRDFDPSQWRNAANDWERLAADAEDAADAVLERGSAKLDEHWTDEVGEAAGEKLRGYANDLQIAAATLRAIVSTLDGFEEAITPLRTVVRSAVDYATGHGLLVDSDGWVSQHPEARSDENADRMGQANDLIQDALRSATRIDEAADEELRRLAGMVSEDDLRHVVNEIQQEASQNQIAMLRESLPIGQDPDVVRAWWDSLSPMQRIAFERAVPVDLYDLDGIPADVKERMEGTGGYNAVDTVRWAQENWDNTAIDVFDNNCATFVSHALNEGGLGMKFGLTGSYGGSDSWGQGGQTGIGWIDSNLGNHTDSWFNSQAQYTFFTEHGGQEVDVSDARPGDVIYFDQVGANDVNPAGEVHHAAVVTAVTPDGDVHYTQHTSSRLDATLDGRLHDIETREGDQRIRIVRPRQTW